MSLEQAVHQRWAATGGLAALLPVEKVTTGLARGGSPPYATLVRKRGRAALRSNAGATLEEVSLRINVWHDDHDAGREIAEEVKAAFDGADLALSSPARAVHIRGTDERDSQRDDGIWRFTLDFLVQVHLPGGA
jgi:hypothetical protein